MKISDGRELDPQAVSTCFLFRARAGWTWEREDQPFYTLWIALEGQGRVFRRGAWVEVSAGAGMLLAPEERVRVQSDRERPLLNFSFRFRSEDAFDRELALSVIWLADLVGVTVLTRKAVEAFGLGDAFSLFKMGKILEVLFLEFQQAIEEAGLNRSGHHDGRVLEMANAIRRNPEVEWEVSQCARQVGLSRSQFTRIFSRLTRSTPVRFIVKCRIQHAARLLAETSMSVAEVAAASGYRDVYYFSKQFHHEMRLSPTGFRRRGAKVGGGSLITRSSGVGEGGPRPPSGGG